MEALVAELNIEIPPVDFVWPLPILEAMLERIKKLETVSLSTEFHSDK